MKENKSLKKFIFILLLTAPCIGFMTTAQAEQYESGITRWNIQEGKLLLVSGVLTDNARLYYLNYSFYVEDKDRTLALVPLIKDQRNLNSYDINFNTFNGGDETLNDAIVVVKGKRTYLITAHKNAPNGYGKPGAVTSKTYQLVVGDEAEWKYYFEPIDSHEYPEKDNYTVERVLSEISQSLR